MRHCVTSGTYTSHLREIYACRVRYSYPAGGKYSANRREIYAPEGDGRRQKSIVMMGMVKMDKTVVTNVPSVINASPWPYLMQNMVP